MGEPAPDFVVRPAAAAAGDDVGLPARPRRPMVTPPPYTPPPTAAPTFTIRPIPVQAASTLSQVPISQRTRTIAETYPNGVPEPGGAVGEVKPPVFNAKKARLFIGYLREGLHRITAARLVGWTYDYVQHLLFMGSKATSDTTRRFYRQVHAAEAQFEAQAVRYITHRARVDPEYALKYLRLRHPRRYNPGTAVTLRPGRPDARRDEGETFERADFGDLSTDDVMALHEVEFGVGTPEERARVMALDGESRRVQSPDAPDLPGAHGPVPGDR